MLKLVYKPLGVVVSVLGGYWARHLFKRCINGDGETPAATQRHRSWTEVLAAALLAGSDLRFARGPRRPGRRRRIRTGHRQWPSDG